MKKKVFREQYNKVDKKEAEVFNKWLELTPEIKNEKPKKTTKKKVEK